MSTTPATQNSQLQKKVATPGERFTAKVMSEFAGHTGSIELTGFQKRLIQNYFVGVDIALKTAEDRRLKKSDKYRDDLPVTWENINMVSLATQVVACARIGFDPALPNHINMVPFKNGTTNKYDIVFVEGYRGKELKAMKYGFIPPDDVIVEIVCANDTFKVHKKDRDNAIETYTFQINDAFDRGDIVGGFWYHSYRETPEKNKIQFYTLAEIEKRKPKYASSEFWGGEKDVWTNGKKTGTEKVEGWFQEMVWKTIYRAAYSAITIDSQKIDDDFMKLLEVESMHEYHMSNIDLGDAKEVVQKEIKQNANKETLNVDDAEEVESPEIPENATPAKEELVMQSPTVKRAF